MKVVELVEKLRKGELEATEVTRSCFEKIESLDSKTNAFVTLNEGALEEAESIDAEEKKDKPLAGLPIGVKDNELTKGIRTTFGSKLYEDYVPEEDSILIERLKEAGAIVVGKTNLPEFALIAYTDNPLLGPTRNPWDLDRTVGGSSGGSAAAVAAGMVPVATGSDGGGSIRIPASFCGLYGLKPSFGRIPSYLDKPIFIGLSSKGFLTKYVEDTAFLLDIVSGKDPRDIDSLPEEEVSYLDTLGESSGVVSSMEDVRMAFSPSLGYTVVDPEVEELVRDAAFRFKKVGEVEEVEIEAPNLEMDLVKKVGSEVLAMMGEELEKWKEVAYPPFLGLLEIVKSVGLEDYIKVYERKEELWTSLSPIFEEYDFLITPTVAVPPFEIGDIGVSEIDGKKASFLGWMPFTYPFNFTAQPAASMPAGFTEEGLPVGMQIVGRRFDDLGVLKISKAYQEINPWQERTPKIAFTD